jgi:hypothetical protein
VPLQAPPGDGETRARRIPRKLGFRFAATQPTALDFKEGDYDGIRQKKLVKWLLAE